MSDKMMVEITSKDGVLFGHDKFERGETRYLANDIAERFIANGWAKVPDAPTPEPGEPQEHTLEVQGGVMGVSGTNPAP